MLHWRRSAHPRAEGSISRRVQTPGGVEHAAHRLRISVKDDEQMGWLVSFLCYGAASDEIDFAWCDVAGADCGKGASDNPLVQKENSIATQLIKRGMPDLFWAQIFGKAYVDLFGLDKLLSSPAYQVEQLTPDAVYVQLQNLSLMCATDPRRCMQGDSWSSAIWTTIFSWIQAVPY